jgi:hypothetical protein
MKVSLKPVVYLYKQRDDLKIVSKDTTFAVTIRIGYKKKYAHIETRYRAGKTELKTFEKEGQKIGELKNGFLTDKCNGIIADYNAIIREAELPDNCTVQDIKELLLKGTAKPDAIDFLRMFEKYLEKNRASASYRIYSATYNHLRSFAGVRLPIENITPNYLTDFERYLEPKMGSRGVNLYMSRVKVIYRWIMDDYESMGYQFRYPFSRTQSGNKYQIPKAKYAKTVALTKEQLRAIIETPLTGIRANRARDLFVISLLSLGTNAKDLYLLDSIGKRIEYKRSKTKGKREDEAFISIAVQPELKPYINKYWTKICTRPFAQMYASPEQLNKAILYGMKQVIKQVNQIYGEGFLWDVDYYDARRSMASIMSNDLELSNDDVSRCLNHVDSRNVMLRPYVERKFDIVDKCNRKFIDWLFSESASDDQH